MLPKRIPPHHHRRMAPPPPPLLLAFAEGVGAASLTALRLHGCPAGAVLLPLTDVPDDPAACLLGPGDASAELRDLGVPLDRSSLLFRSTNRSDDAAVAALSCRATGQAPVSVLELESVLVAARAGGLAAVPKGLTRLSTLLEAAADRLRSGDRPEIWLVGFGDVHAVHTMFDVAHHWHRRIAAPLGQQLRLRVTGEAATVIASNQRALDHARELFTSAPFVAHGAVTTVRPDTLRFAAGTGIAFGAQRVGARAAHRTEAAACRIDCI